MKILKTHKGIVSVLMMLTFLLCGTILPHITVEAVSGEPLTVGVPKDRCPVFYEDPDTGEIVGIGADLMRIAAEKAGYDVTFKVVEEPTLKDALDNATYDVLMPFGSMITSSEGKAGIVSENLLQMPFTLVTANKWSLPPLNELHVGMLASLGGGAESVSQSYPGIEITFYDTVDEEVDALRAGKVNALLHNTYVWSYVLQKPSYKDLTEQPLSMFSMDFRVGAVKSPESEEIIDRLNKGILSLTEEERQSVILDYTSRNLYQYDVYDFLYTYGLLLIIGVFLVIILILIIIPKLRKKRQ